MPVIRTASYKIVVEPISSVYVHECRSPNSRREIGTPWLTKGKRAIHCSNLDIGSAKSASHAGWLARFKCKTRKVQGC